MDHVNFFRPFDDRISNLRWASKMADTHATCQNCGAGSCWGGGGLYGGGLGGKGGGEGGGGGMITCHAMVPLHG